MKLGLINSAWSQAGRETAWGLQKTKALGFDTVDIFTDPLDISAQERQRIRRECERLQLPIVSVCCVATGLIDLNPSVRRFHLDRCRKYLELVYEFQGHNLLLVLGEYLWNREVIPPTQQWDWAVAASRQLGDIAAELGVHIALELEPFPLSLLNSVEAMVRFLDDVAHPAVQANIDISHLCLAKVAATELQRLKGRAIHVHISDCDGIVHGDLPPGRGVVPFDSYLSELAKLDLKGAVSIELEYSPEPERIEQWVAEAYDSTDRLLRRHGLRG
jgi:D-psicose/D-tagatose/L-ribulose 3-epimerase